MSLFLSEKYMKIPAQISDSVIAALLIQSDSLN